MRRISAVHNLVAQFAGIAPTEHAMGMPRI